MKVNLIIYEPLHRKFRKILFAQFNLFILTIIIFFFLVDLICMEHNLYYRNKLGMKSEIIDGNEKNWMLL